MLANSFHNAPMQIIPKTQDMYNTIHNGTYTEVSIIPPPLEIPSYQRTIDGTKNTKTIKIKHIPFTSILDSFIDLDLFHIV